MNTIYIYVLKCPTTNAIRYVGASKHPQKRLCGHITDAKRRPNSTRAQWILGLLDKGMRPAMQIVATANTDTLAVLENYWINYYRGLGYDLVNCVEGGTSHGRYPKKVILQYEVGGVTPIRRWYGARKASLGTGIQKSCITACCRGVQETAGGYRWNYADED